MKCFKIAAVAAGTFLALGAASPAFAGSHADSVAANSPGVLSGNVLEIPVDVPVNLCGDTTNATAGLNPAFGDTCANADS